MHTYSAGIAGGRELLTGLFAIYLPIDEGVQLSIINEKDMHI